MKQIILLGITIGLTCFAGCSSPSHTRTHTHSYHYYPSPMWHSHHYYHRDYYYVPPTDDGGKDTTPDIQPQNQRTPRTRMERSTPMQKSPRRR